MKRELPLLAILALAGALAPVTGAAAAHERDEPSPSRFEVRLEEATIPMQDGVGLAADLWRPQGAAAGERFPVLLEYLPYRKDEGRGERYDLYAYFVRRGF